MLIVLMGYSSQTLVPSAATNSVWEMMGRPASPAATIWSVVDRKSTRLNSSHSQISYAVFCLKKKNKKNVLSQLHQRCDGHLRSHGGRLTRHLPPPRRTPSRHLSDHLTCSPRRARLADRLSFA